MSTPNRPHVVCLPCHGPRLSTLLETAEALLFFRMRNGHGELIDQAPMPCGCSERAVALEIVAKGADVLVCGGVTCETLATLEEKGVHVLAWVCGNAGCVLSAYGTGRLAQHTMPGCGSRARKRNRRR